MRHIVKALSYGIGPSTSFQKRIEDESLQMDRYSDSIIEEKMKEKAEENDGIRKNAENAKASMILRPMSELLQTERDYIDDLKRLIDVYLMEYRCSGSMCPMNLRNKETEIFGNIEELFRFHSE